MWTALPLFWTAGMNTAMGATLAAGGCWIMQEGFDPGEALRLMARERVTEPYTLPHQARALAEHPDWLTTDLSALRQVYGKSVFTRHPTVQRRPELADAGGLGHVGDLRLRLGARQQRRSRDHAAQPGPHPCPAASLRSST